MTTQQTYEHYLVRRVNKKFDKAYPQMLKWFETQILKLKNIQMFFSVKAEPVTTKELDASEERRHVYVAKITVTVKRWDPTRYELLVSTISNACNYVQKWNVAPWEHHQKLNDDFSVDSIIGNVKADDLVDSDGITAGVQFKDISLDKGDFFKELYGVDQQIEMVLNTVRAAAQTDFVHRFHTVLHGEPGCGKTQTLECLCHMISGLDEFGKQRDGEGTAYIKLDAVSTTQAGAEKFFLHAPFIPAVVVIEEIEKVNEQAMRWLLGVLDRRGEIRKNNARVGMVSRRVHSLVLCTVNDKRLFDTALSGALSSRFPNAIHYPRPSRSILQAIMMREVAKVKGDPRWVQPALALCQELQITDPRRAVMVCMCGGKGLLDGSYRKSLIATMSSVELKEIEARRAMAESEEKLAELRLKLAGTA